LIGVYDGLPLFLFSPARQRQILKQHREGEVNTYRRLMRERRPEPWDDLKTKFQKLLLLDAASWKPTFLFDLPPLRGNPTRRLSEAQRGAHFAYAPGRQRRWAYCPHVLPKTYPLKIAQHKQRGLVYFTRDVIVPTLLEFVPGDEPTVWMSYTPMELFTQRAAVLAATGRVVVGGLGLGWLLSKVRAKPSVTEVVLVEREAALVAWLRPALERAYPALASVTWVVDDVWKFMDADVPVNGERTKYLLDIWNGYGSYSSHFDRWKTKLGRRLWGWGMGDVCVD
jgi:hypothetical protein